MINNLKRISQVFCFHIYNISICNHFLSLSPETGAYKCWLSSPDLTPGKEEPIFQEFAEFELQDAFVIVSHDGENFLDFGHEILELSFHLQSSLEPHAALQTVIEDLVDQSFLILDGLFNVVEEV